jgi:hypothetical protein
MDNMPDGGDAALRVSFDHRPGGHQGSKEERLYGCADETPGSYEDSLNTVASATLFWSYRCMGQPERMTAGNARVDGFRLLSQHISLRLM